MSTNSKVKSMEITSKQSMGHASAKQSDYLKKLGDSMNFVADIPPEEQNRLLKMYQA